MAHREMMVPQDLRVQQAHKVLKDRRVTKAHKV